MFPPQEAVRFKSSAGLVWLLRFFVVFFLGVVGLGVFALATDRNPAKDWPMLPPVMLFGVCFAVLSWNAIGRARDQIAVDEAGIWRLPPKGEPVFIAWRDVGVVRADDTMQRLIVSGRSRAHIVRLEYQLDDFSTLRDYVIQHTVPATRAKQTSGSVFYRTWINKCILLFFVSLYIVAAVFIFAADRRGFSTFFFGMAALTLVPVVRDPLSLTIKSDRVVINYPGWKREISFSEIDSATLSNISGKGNVWARVVISLKHQKFRDGSLALLQALQDALGQTPSSGEASQVA
jgi:hypothetical protein